MLPPAPPPLSRLEKLVLEHTDFDIQVSFEAQCENVRRWLRAEIEKRLREHARPKTIAVPCGGCGSPVDITAGYAVQVSGQHPLGRGVELVCRVGFPVPAGSNLTDERARCRTLFRSRRRVGSAARHHGEAGRRRKG